MWAVAINSIDIIHQLLQAGADVHIQDKGGHIAWLVVGTVTRCMHTDLVRAWTLFQYLGLQPIPSSYY